MHRHGLRDDEWDRIKHLLPGQEGWVGVTAKDNRLFVEAVLYRCRTGVPRRDLPERFGDWKNIHRRYSRWARSGVWERVFQHLAADADHEYAMHATWQVRSLWSDPRCFARFFLWNRWLRQIRLGHDGMVAAPALIPKRTGERVNTNRHDAITAGPAAPGGRAHCGMGSRHGPRGDP